MYLVRIGDSLVYGVFAQAGEAFMTNSFYIEDCINPSYIGIGIFLSTFLIIGC